MYLNLFSKLYVLLVFFLMSTLAFYSIGYCIDIIFLKLKLDKFSRYILQLALGIASFSFYSVIAFIFQISLSVTVWLWILISIVLFVYIIYKVVTSKVNKNKKGKRYFGAYLFIGVSLLAILFLSNQLLSESRYDSDFWYFLAQIRYFIDNDIVINRYPYFKSVSIGATYPYNSFFLIIAMITKLSGFYSWEIWEASRVFLIITFTVIHYNIFCALLKHKKLAWLATLFIFSFIFCFPGTHYGWIPMHFANNPNNASTCLFGSMLVFVSILYLRYRLISLLPVCFMLGFAIQNWHVQNIMLIGLVLGGITIGTIIFGKIADIKASCFLLLATFMGACLMYLIEYPILSKAQGPYFLYSPNYLACRPDLFHKLTDTLYIVHYKWVTQSWRLVSLIFVALYAFIGRSKTARIIIVGISLAALLFCFNPIILSPLLRIIPAYTAPRILRILPCYLIFGLLPAELIFFVMRKLSHKKRFWVIGSIKFALVIMLIISIPVIKNYKHNGFTSPAFLEFVSFFNKHIEPGSKVLSDTRTNYLLPAFKHVYIVASRKTFIKSYAPGNFKKLDRDLRTFFFDPKMTDQRRHIFNNRWHVDYIVVNKFLRIPRYGEINHMIGFNLIFDNSAFTIFKRKK